MDLGKRADLPRSVFVIKEGQTQSTMCLFDLLPGSLDTDKELMGAPCLGNIKNLGTGMCFKTRIRNLLYDNS